MSRAPFNSTTSRKDKISWAIRILLSILFLFSVFAKLYPSPYSSLATFEAKQLNVLGFAPEVSVYFSRFMIGAELALGILLLQRHYFKRLVLPVAFLMLLGFCIHLAIQIGVVGDKGNCGCMGNLMPMKPSGAIIKNVIAMILMAIVFFVTPKNYDRRNFLVVLSVTLASILSLFLIPMSIPVSTPLALPSAMDEIDLPQPTADTLAPQPTAAAVNPAATTTTATTATAVPEKVDEPAQKKSGFSNLYADIDKGKKVLCFFAPGCDHCKETAKELTQLRKGNPDFPKIQIVFMDEEAELIPAFFEYAGATYPHQIMEIGQFWQVLGGNRDTPGVFYIWNGNIVKTYDGINENAFRKNEFKALVKKPWSEIKK